MLYLGLDAGLIGPLGTREAAGSRDAVTAISSANKSSSGFLQHTATSQHFCHDCQAYSAQETYLQALI